MVSRESSFTIGGSLVVGLGVVIAAGLWLSGAGAEFFGAWLGAALAVGFGAFFVHVGIAEGADRRRELADLERTAEHPPGPRAK